MTENKFLMLSFGEFVSVAVEIYQFQDRAVWTPGTEALRCY
jgi:hypothetical protein